MSQGTVIATFRYRHEAETAAGFLRYRKIASAVFVDDGGGSYPAINSAGARLVVPTVDAEEAREVLADAGVTTE